MDREAVKLLLHPLWRRVNTRIIKAPFWLMFFVLLVGCSLYPIQQTLQENQVVETVTSVSEETPRLPAVTTSPTPANIFQIQTYCSEETVRFSDLQGLSGSLVFSADNVLSEQTSLVPQPGKNSMLSFWHPQLEKISSYDLEEGEEYYYYAVSPRGEKLALTQGKTATVSYDLIVLDNQGQIMGRKVVPDEWSFYHWLNNDQLLLQRLTVRERFDLLATRLADKQQQTIPTNFPNIYLSQPVWSWGSQILLNPEAPLVDCKSCFDG